MPNNLIKQLHANHADKIVVHTRTETHIYIKRERQTTPSTHSSHTTHTTHNAALTNQQLDIDDAADFID